MQSIKNIIDAKLGLKIVRTSGKIGKFLQDDSTKRPVFVDFIGPSGVGKTTLFNEVYKMRKMSEPWFTTKEILYNLKSKTTIVLPDIYQDIADAKIKDIQSKDFYSPIHKLRQFSFVYTVLQDEITVQSVNNNNIVVAEDGFYHVYGNEIISLLKSNQRKYRDFITNRALILCIASPERIAHQIFKRLKKEEVRAQHLGKSLSELISQQINVIAERKEIASYVEQLGVPVLTVNTEKDSAMNAEKVTHFLKSLY